MSSATAQRCPVTAEDGVSATSWHETKHRASPSAEYGCGHAPTPHRDLRLYWSRPMPTTAGNRGPWNHAWVVASSSGGNGREGNDDDS